ncbi:MAG: hypothetical protein PHW90_01810 [Bacilli bacterium]|nr:hypothetical protein [Bacilli bacterium]
MIIIVVITIMKIIKYVIIELSDIVIFIGFNKKSFLINAINVCQGLKKEIIINRNRGMFFIC